ncbi:hypothetical protein ONZ45_g13849 [Pleurotus djamor]|nr:hypothetical protein ONZ45_g13849 [Pleurotus djamor]
MSDRKIIFTEEATPPLPVYSQAVVSNGVVYASGNISYDRNFELVDSDRAAIKNLETILKASGSSLQHILKVNIYLTNLKDDFARMNEVYTGFFEPGNLPARTCVGVAALPLGAVMEIDCIAAVIQSCAAGLMLERAAIKNLEIVLKASGSSLKHVLKVNLYLTNLKDDFAPMNEVYTEFFEPGNFPARTCVGVAALPLGAAMEIECVAAVAQ